MPLGPWGSFDECVAANSDKSSPEGFCAWLEHKLTGQWPSQASKVAPEVLAQFDSQANLALNEALKTLHFQALETKSVQGVEVFSAGTWTNSSGEIREWAKADLQKMAGCFSPHTIPLKIGHTSPEFNQKVAEAMGVPVALLTGDGSSKGQIALGYASQLKVKGDKLLADFEGVPTPLADLIEGGQYVAVSSEIEFDGGIPRLSAVALLGAQQPAVKNLAGLEAAKIFGQRANAKVFSFSKDKKIGGNMSNFTKDTPITEMVGTFQEGAQDALTAIAVALGLDPANASLGTLLKAIQDLKAGPVTMPEEMVAQKQEFASMKETLKHQQVTIAKFEHNERVATYEKLAIGWKALAGKPEEIAQQLAETEEKAGKPVANLVVAQFQAANKAAVDAGVLVPLGRSKAGPANPEADTKIKEFEMAGMSRPKALQKLSKEHPHLFRQFQADNLGKGDNGSGE